MQLFAAFINAAGPTAVTTNSGAQAPEFGGLYQSRHRLIDAAADIDVDSRPRVVARSRRIIGLPISWPGCVGI